MEKLDLFKPCLNSLRGSENREAAAKTAALKKKKKKKRRRDCFSSEFVQNIGKHGEKYLKRLKFDV